MHTINSQIRRPHVPFCRQTMDNTSTTQALTLKIPESGTYHTHYINTTTTNNSKPSLLPATSTTATENNNEEYLIVEVGEKMKRGRGRLNHVANAFVSKQGTPSSPSSPSSTPPSRDIFFLTSASTHCSYKQLDNLLRTLPQ